MKGASLTALSGSLISSFLALVIISGCTENIRYWSGDAVVLGNIQVITADGKDFSGYCVDDYEATDDYLPDQSYSYHKVSRNRLVIIRRYKSDGTYFAAAALNKPIHLFLNCRQVLEDTMTKQTVYDVHIDIGNFVTSQQKAVSYLGHLTVQLQSDGRVTTGLNNGDRARFDESRFSAPGLQLPLIQIPLTSIAGPSGWSGRTHSGVKVLFP
jgi:hypothetical protein